MRAAMRTRSATLAEHLDAEWRRRPGHVRTAGALPPDHANLGTEAFAQRLVGRAPARLQADGARERQAAGYMPEYLLIPVDLLRDGADGLGWGRRRRQADNRWHRRKSTSMRWPKTGRRSSPCPSGSTPPTGRGWSTSASCRPSRWVRQRAQRRQASDARDLHGPTATPRAFLLQTTRCPSRSATGSIGGCGDSGVGKQNVAG